MPPARNNRRISPIGRFILLLPRLLITRPREQQKPKQLFKSGASAVLFLWEKARSFLTRPATQDRSLSVQSQGFLLIWLGAGPDAAFSCGRRSAQAAAWWPSAFYVIGHSRLKNATNSCSTRGGKFRL
jgi:hypothetical protein